jgi:hypothetical protein
MLCSAVTVECCALKPCWCSLLSMLFVICGSITFSRVLAMGDTVVRLVSKMYPVLGLFVALELGRF